VKQKVQLDSHNRNLVSILERDSKSNEVFNLAEERIGQELERQRQAKILERIEFEKQI
jgi:hypothetical protein